MLSMIFRFMEYQLFSKYFENVLQCVSLLEETPGFASGTAVADLLEGFDNRSSEIEFFVQLNECDRNVPVCWQSFLSGEGYSHVFPSRRRRLGAIVSCVVTLCIFANCQCNEYVHYGRAVRVILNSTGFSVFDYFLYVCPGTISMNIATSDGLYCPYPRLMASQKCLFQIVEDADLITFQMYSDRGYSLVSYGDVCLLDEVRQRRSYLDRFTMFISFSGCHDSSSLLRTEFRVSQGGWLLFD